MNNMNKSSTNYIALSIRLIFLHLLLCYNVLFWQLNDILLIEFQNENMKL